MVFVLLVSVLMHDKVVKGHFYRLPRPLFQPLPTKSFANTIREADPKPSQATKTIPV